MRYSNYMITDLPVTVAIPVGPFAANKRWLAEAIDSAHEAQADEILLISDMAGGLGEYCTYPEVVVWETPWRVGVATAFNFGVALAEHDLVFMLGSDDTLMPDCLIECVKTYKSVGRPDEKYFAVGVRYSDDREDKDQYTPCNAAMVSKALWERCGGFPIETGSGAPDAALMSIFLKNKDAGTWHIVNGSRPLYNYRVHPGTDTAQRQPWQGVILKTRDILTAQWKPPIWIGGKE